MPWSWPLRILRGLLLLLALAGVVVTAIPGVLGSMAWWVRYLDFPRLEVLIGMLVVWMCLALLPRSRVCMLAMLGMAAACAYDAWVLFPYTTVAGTQQTATQACPAGDRLRLLEVNVQMTNRHDDTLLNIVRDVKPDVAWFQETNSWWQHELSPLSGTMPYHVAAARPNYFGVDLYSRFKLVEPQVRHLTHSGNPSVFTGVQLPSGDVVKLYAIHPRPPQQGQSVEERNAQLLSTALAARHDTEPHVVAGDMNSVPWEGIIRHTERVGRFLDPRIGRGLFMTWNAKSFLLHWPLDQILPGPGFTLTSLKVLPAFGSDHRPYVAELCREPGAVAHQSPPKLLPHDIQTARIVVRKGMGQADKTGYKGQSNPGSSGG